MPALPNDPRRPMDGLTRRTLLRASGVAGVGALLAGAAGLTWRQMEEGARREPLPGRAPILIIATLYGGNDGLNTLVPYADPAYRDARPGMAYDEAQVLRLDADFGLNPGLKGMAQLWAEDKLAIVRGVGYPNPDRSHFRSMDIWQTASPTEPVSTGWIGRYLDARADGAPGGSGHSARTPSGVPTSGAVHAINIGSTLPPLAVGATRTAGALDPRTVGQVSTEAEAVVRALAAQDPSDGPAAAEVVDSYAEWLDLRTTLGSRWQGTSQDASEGRLGLAAQLDVVARAIAIGAPTTVYLVSMASFDTHADELTAQESLLTDFDQAITGFRAALVPTGRASDVVVFAYSEFGRRVAANASEGTDHGTAGTAFLLGDRVRAGYHGDQPSLTRLTDDDLLVTTDFRSICAELTEKMLGADPQRVVPGAPPSLGLLT